MGMMLRTTTVLLSSTILANCDAALWHQKVDLGNASLYFCMA